MKNRERKGKLKRNARFKLYMQWYKDQLAIYKAENARLQGVIDKIKDMISVYERAMGNGQ